MSNRKRVCLLLTATIDVRGVPSLARSDPLERLSDYRWALERWVRCRAIDSIVFVENSGYDTESLQGVAREPTATNVEFLSFDGQNFPRNLGKGFGETLNLEHALDRSATLASNDGDWLIMRSNGRNYVENIDVLAEALRGSTDILCDFKELLTWGDGRVLGGTVTFFRDYVCPYGRGVNDSNGYYFEHALARAIHRGMADGLVWRPFPERPRLRGFSGTSNRDYAESRVTRAARELQHKVKLRMLRL